jgi:hypothetical protein
MRQQVIVQFGRDPRDAVEIHAEEAALPADQARRWLDDEFVANDCEPLRASGKVLTVDKVLVLAGTVGRERLVGDPAWAQAFARAALGALGRPLVRVDVAEGAITY